MTKSKGFTLIELLVVIAIVAVLAVVVILTLNPAELLRQARDSNRVSDAATLKSAMALYLADVTQPVIGTPCDFSSTAGCGSPVALCFESNTSSPSAAGCGANATLGFTGGAATYNASSGRTDSFHTASARNVDGTGWLPVAFTAISSKSPIANLPVDPVNNASFYYMYAATGSTSVAPTYKMIMNGMESQKYGNKGGNDVVSTDGGTVSSSLEFGSNMGL